MKDRLRIVCTGGQLDPHPERDLGLVMWSPAQSAGDDGLRMWGPNDRREMVAESIAEIARQTRKQTNHVTKRSAMATRQRADGGTTFIVKCPTCTERARVRGKRLIPRELRDDRLWSFVRQSSGDSLDVSALP